ncbi:MAG TPA: AMP-binding protein, partial [Gemmatimonadales bacterium]|nr:AMP-binding protein [Gemmatimonadales bacterium]
MSDHGEETLVDLLRVAAATYGDRTALSIRAGLREDAWSYTRLWRAAIAVAHYLRDDLGLRPGARVVIWAPNGPRLVACLFGTMLARLVAVPLDPFSTPEFIARVAERTDAALLITGFAKPKTAGGRTVLLDDLPYATGRCAPAERPTRDDIAEIVFTSGTTGDPKGVILTHGNIVSNVRSAGILIGRARLRLLSLLPLSHMLEQTLGLYLPLRDGATIVYPGSRQSAAIARALRRHRIEAMIVVPQVLRMLLDGIEREARGTGRERALRRAHRLAERVPWPGRRWLFRRVHQRLGGRLSLVICGGATLPPDLAAAWERMGVRVVEGYGATECAPVIAANTPQRRIHGTVGRPAPGVDVRLSTEGEILVRGPNVTSGYWRDAAGTRQAFTEDGWFRTGDLAERDPAGSLRLLGRLKDVIVLPSGLKVFPEDVERELRREEGVADCVVVGGPSRTGAPVVHAVIIPAHRDADAASRRQDALRAVRNANGRLAPHQRIAGVTLWEEDDFPRTNLQKVRRHEVLRMLAGEKPQAPSAAPLAGVAGERFARLANLMQRLGAAGEAITPESDLSLDLHLDSLSRV